MNLARVYVADIFPGTECSVTELVRRRTKTTDELDAIFWSRRRYDKPIVVSCGSGVMAAVVLLALATLDSRQT